MIRAAILLVLLAAKSAKGDSTGYCAVYTIRNAPCDTTPCIMGEGDCDSDEQCQEGLVCSKRSAGAEPDHWGMLKWGNYPTKDPTVPHPEAAHQYSDTDFCVDLNHQYLPCDTDADCTCDKRRFPAGLINRCRNFWTCGNGSDECGTDLGPGSGLTVKCIPAPGGFAAGNPRETLTHMPTSPTYRPTKQPTAFPTTKYPTKFPTTKYPTKFPVSATKYPSGFPLPARRDSAE